MLKTPHYPVWLCSSNGRHWVAFCTKRSLLSDWRKEHVFQLCCYDGQATQLTVGERPLLYVAHDAPCCLGDLATEYPCVCARLQIPAPTTGKQRPQRQPQRRGWPHWR